MTLQTLHSGLVTLHKSLQTLDCKLITIKGSEQETEDSTEREGFWIGDAAVEALHLHQTLARQTLARQTLPSKTQAYHKLCADM